MFGLPARTNTAVTCTQWALTQSAGLIGPLVQSSRLMGLTDVATVPPSPHQLTLLQQLQTRRAALQYLAPAAQAAPVEAQVAQSWNQQAHLALQESVANVRGPQAPSREQRARIEARNLGNQKHPRGRGNMGSMQGMQARRRPGSSSKRSWRRRPRTRKQRRTKERRRKRNRKKRRENPGVQQQKRTKPRASAHSGNKERGENNQETKKVLCRVGRFHPSRGSK